MADYPLRNVPNDLWRQVKSKAAYEGRTIRFVLLELLRIYAKHGFAVVEKFDKEKGH